MNLGTAQVIQGDARHLPLDDNTVDLVVTSPPYFALRSYQDGGEHYAGQIGSEPTPAEFVAALLEVTRECVRVLKPSGSLWVNLGDKYATGPPVGTSLAGGMVTGRNGEDIAEMKRLRPNIDTTAFAPRKSLIGIPWRYALACIDDLGLILRAELIWSKPNGLPESVTDRVRRSHEQWFHFTLEPRYFSAVDEIREQYEPDSAARRIKYGANPKPQGRGVAPESRGGRQGGVMGFGGPDNVNPLGKLPGSVWSIPTQPLQVPDHLGVDHFAAFPTEWPRRIIQGWSPSGVCVECGEGRRPVVDKERTRIQATHNGRMWASPGAGELDPRPHITTATITGYACACWDSIDAADFITRDEDPMWGRDAPYPAPPTTPAVVLDPFGGTGTTALVAKALGRHGITIDMSADYSRLALWRTNDRNQLAKVLGVAKVDAPDASQLDLFGEATA